MHLQEWVRPLDTGQYRDWLRVPTPTRGTGKGLVWDPLGAHALKAEAEAAHDLLRETCEESG